MRVIKFRAWEPLNAGGGGGYMVEWENLKTKIAGTIFSDTDHVIMQFTGLHDKKGREIYEGDILKQIYPGLWVVEFEIGRFQLVRHDDKCRDYFRRKKCSCQSQDMEIIGNIHETPELLTGGKHGKS